MTRRPPILPYQSMRSLTPTPILSYRPLTIGLNSESYWTVYLRPNFRENALLDS